MRSMDKSGSSRSGFHHYCKNLVIMLVLLSSCSRRPDLEMNDFEGAAYGTWQTNGVAFGTGPTYREFLLDVRGMRGTKFASSRHGGPSGRGTLISPKFKVERRYL